MMAHPSGKTMNIIGFEKYGNPTQLKKTNVAYPHGFNASNNIVIKVHAAAINPVDKGLLSGDLKMVLPVATFPHVICYDVAGVVEKQTLRGNSLWVNPSLLDCLEAKRMVRKPLGTEAPWRSTVLRIHPMLY